MTEESFDGIKVNGRSYRKPTARTVVICFDGCDPRYISHGLSAGLLPNISKMMSEGFFAIADAAMPTFTNPNNMSIVTGAPPRVHGISGNYYLDKATGREVMITDASLVSSGTVLAALADAGMRVAAITAKDKLRKMLGSGLKGICFSSERAREATLKENGIDEVERLVGRPTPDMYSPDLSLFVLDAGIRLLETRRADVLYLSLSDMVQHSAGPGEELADSFNREVDKRVGRMLELDAVVAIVADHGMTDKCTPDGQPQVVYLERALNDQFGPSSVRVICPRPDEHDLTGLTGHRLRSHGGLSEQPVPFMLSRPLNATYRAIGENRRLRNFDIFDFALNGTV